MYIYSWDSCNLGKKIQMTSKASLWSLGSNDIIHNETSTLILF